MQGNQLSERHGRRMLGQSCWFLTSMFAGNLDLYLTCLLLPQEFQTEDWPLTLCFAEGRKGTCYHSKFSSCVLPRPKEPLCVDCLPLHEVHTLDPAHSVGLDS